MRSHSTISGIVRLAGLALVFVASAVAQQGQSVSQVAQRVDKFYNSLQSLKADFTQTYNGAGLNRSETGTVWLKQPGKMRWDYQKPAQKLFVTDGKTAWFYAPADQQARKAPVKKLDDLRSPLRYLLGKTKLEKEFDGLSLAPDVKPITAGYVVLRGVPKALADRVEQVQLEINQNNEIVRIVIQEVGGTATEFRFTNLQANAPVADTLFRSPVPAGVPVVDASDLSPQ